MNRERVGPDNGLQQRVNHVPTEQTVLSERLSVTPVTGPQGAGGGQGEPVPPPACPRPCPPPTPVVLKLFPWRPPKIPW